MPKWIRCRFEFDFPAVLLTIGRREVVDKLYDDVPTVVKEPD